MEKLINKQTKNLKNGKIILYPSDTIWGLGCDATNEIAVSKIFKIKSRPLNKPLLILVPDLSILKEYIHDFPDEALEIINKKEPTTIIYQNGKNLPQGIIAPDGSVGIRIPKKGFALELVKNFGKPIVSTSANISGKKIPKNLMEISDEILYQVDDTVNLEKNNFSTKPSNIVKITSEGKLIKIR